MSSATKYLQEEEGSLRSCPPQSQSCAPNSGNSAPDRGPLQRPDGQQRRSRTHDERTSGAGACFRFTHNLGRAARSSKARAAWQRGRAPRRKSYLRCGQTDAPPRGIWNSRLLSTGFSLAIRP